MVETSDSSDLSVYFTNPDEVKEFCERSGCDVLTTSFGTVHGMYSGEPNLDFKLLREIKNNAGDISLGMHGGSGIPFDQIQKAISAGVKKINYFTAIDTAPAPYIAKAIQESKHPVNFYNLANLAMEIIYEETVQILEVFKNGGNLNK